MICLLMHADHNFNVLYIDRLNRPFRYRMYIDIDDLK